MSGRAKFCTWMVFGLAMAPLFFATVFMTMAVFMVGLWDPDFPLRWKQASPALPIALWLEIYLTAAVHEWSLND